MDRELETIKRMIEIYCTDKHAGAEGLCDDCKTLLDYAVLRIGKCPQTPKPKCSKCKIHCFSVEMRTRIKEVMRYSGPRMLLIPIPRQTDIILTTKRTKRRTQSTQRSGVYVSFV